MKCQISYSVLLGIHLHFCFIIIIIIQRIVYYIYTQWVQHNEVLYIATNTILHSKMIIISVNTYKCWSQQVGSILQHKQNGSEHIPVSLKEHNTGKQK